MATSFTPLATTSLTDKKEYALLRLANGLEAILISVKDGGANGVAHDEPAFDQDGEDDDDGDDDDGDDDDGDDDDDDDGDGSAAQGSQPPMAAACMMVNCGSFDEARDDAPSGLAHFLEHMLFMGSTKYPKENCYDDFLSSQGGSSNAWTDAEQTCYYFDVPQQGLHHALDIFAQFFIAPLLLADALNRETEAVDSEFELSRTDDDSRLAEIYAMLAPNTSPYSRFCCGNKHTLRVEGIRQKLLDLHRDFYIAANMRLVVWGIEPLDALRSLVESTFAALPTCPGRPRALPAPAHAWQDVLGRGRSDSVLCVVPVQDRHALRVRWQLPSLKAQYRSRPASYVAHVLGHESAGSLLSALKRKELATELVAGVTYDDGGDNSSLASVFAVDVKLTERGVREYASVVAALFAAVGLLRAQGPLEWVFREQSAMHELAFKYKDEGEPSDVVCELASELIAGVPPADVLAAGHLWFDFDAAAIAGVAALLGASGATAPQIALTSSLFGREQDWAQQQQQHCAPPASAVLAPAASAPLVEPLYGARFWHVPVEAATVALWERALAQGAGFDASLQLAMPQPNPFVPTDTAVRPLDAQRVARDALRAAEPLLDAHVELQVAGERKKPTRLPARVVAADGPDRLLLRFDADGAEQWHARTAVRVLWPQLPPAPAALRGCAMRVWHLQAAQVPRQAVFLALRDAAAHGLGRARADLACAVASHVLTDALYMAQQAELEAAIRTDEQGFYVHVWGFSQHCVALAETAVRALVDACRQPPAAVLAMEREALKRKLRNADANPARFASHLRLRAIVPGTPSSQALLAALDNDDAPPLQLLHKACAAVLLVHGNASEAEARAASARLAQQVKVTADAGPPLPRVVALKPGRKVLVVQAAEAQENNVAVHRYYQLGRDEPEARAMGFLLEMALEERFFDELRTKQQVGYAVSCTARHTHGVLGFSFDVTSSRVAPSDIDARIDAFLKGVQRWLDDDVDDAEVRELCASLAARLLRPDSGLFEESRAHWQAIEDRSHAFHDRFALAHWLTHSGAKGTGPGAKALRAFYKRGFVPGASLSVWVVGALCSVANAQAERAKLKPKEALDQPEQVHAACEVWRL